MPYGGERVYTSGMYHSVHYLCPEHDADLAFVAGQVFPRCTVCKDVEYILVIAAPGAREVADFTPPQKKKGSASSS
jgi:hypothetical protein